MHHHDDEIVGLRRLGFPKPGLLENSATYSRRKISIMSMALLKYHSPDKQSPSIAYGYTASSAGVLNASVFGVPHQETRGSSRAISCSDQTRRVPGFSGWAHESGNATHHNRGCLNQPTVTESARKLQGNAIRGSRKTSTSLASQKRKFQYSG